MVSADKPGETGEIVVYDDATLEEVSRIPDLMTLKTDGVKAILTPSQLTQIFIAFAMLGLT